jgi:hypothetical protein
MAIEDNNLMTICLLFESEIKMEDYNLMTRFVSFLIDNLDSVIPQGICSILNLLSALIRCRPSDIK